MSVVASKPFVPVSPLRHPLVLPQYLHQEITRRLPFCLGWQTPSCTLTIRVRFIPINADDGQCAVRPHVRILPLKRHLFCANCGEKFGKSCESDFVLIEMERIDIYLASRRSIIIIHDEFTRRNQHAWRAIGTGNCCCNCASGRGSCCSGVCRRRAFAWNYRASRAASSVSIGP